MHADYIVAADQMFYRPAVNFHDFQHVSIFFINGTNILAFLDA